MNDYNNLYSTPTNTPSENTNDVADEFEGNIAPVLKEDDEVINLGEDFDFDGFQVVRREFFAHTREPSCTFNNCKFYVNSACLSKFPTSDFAQVLINRENKILALRPCPEGARDSFQWCTLSKGKRKPKAITCRLFFAKVVSMMEWDPNHRYKMLGKIIHSNNEYLLAFDLSSCETYQRTFIDGEKPKTSRTPVYPADWQNQFGLPYNEHKQSMKINIVDGYAVYSIKETSKPNKATEETNNGVPEATILALGNGNSGGEAL
ncbi:MAG: hypothetical protein IJ285_03070 [Clostridia bacterium]|nr:hypothetical protein [Clostridia bacterium]